LEDWTILDLDDQDEEYRNQTNSTEKKSSDDVDAVDDNDENGAEEEATNTNDGQPDATVNDNHHHSSLRMTIPTVDNLIPAEPMVGQSLLRQWFSCNYEQPIRLQQHDSSLSRRLPQYRMYRTKYTQANDKSNASSFPWCTKGIIHILKQFIFILQMRNTWKVLIFSFASVPVVLQWTASEIVLPPFLERRYGELIPIYTIQSIHMVGCLVFPPFAQTLTSALEDFRVVIPGVSSWGISALTFVTAYSLDTFT
jgi:hypothetical protein